MKRKFEKLIALCTALVFSTGAFLFCAGFTRVLPRGTFVNDVDVSGMTVTRAKETLRRSVVESLKEKHLHICADERVFTYIYPEIDFRDGFGDTLENIRRSGDYYSPVHYFLNGAEEIARGLCEDMGREAEEPYEIFNTEGEPFTYYDGSDGIVCDERKLLDDISASLNGTFEDVRICTSAVARRTTVEDVKKRTVKLYSFVTYFDGDNTDRSANIRLAARKINGTKIEAGEEFSFNATVGPRTESNGFKQAKIIENGKFVLGYGGGVCQVSTTLYNAVLLSGLDVTEYHPHSLQVSYVAPSRDAMVSGSYFDLKFRNNRNTPVYLRMNCTLSSVCCTVYGQSDGYEYSFKSNPYETVPRPQTVIVEGDEDKVISYGRDGTKSEGYLVARRNGEESVKLIRKDEYLAVADVVQRAPADSTCGG